MHILVVNDDGPPSNQSSPYVHSLVSTLQSAGHTVSVVLPHIQRSWIGKAHIVGQTIKPVYFRPDPLLSEGSSSLNNTGVTSSRPLPSDSKEEEWILVDSTPATCVQIGLHHYFKSRGPVDLVVSGPNYGRNTTAVFALSSGTLGGALEAAVSGFRSIALSYAFFDRNHDPKIISDASQLSLRLIEYLANNWDPDVQLYSVNVPLIEKVGERKVYWTEMLQNSWSSGSCFEEINVPEDDDLSPDEQEVKIRREESRSSAGVTESNAERSHNDDSGSSHIRYAHKHFKWAPKFKDVYESVERAGPGSDGWVVKEGYTSVTPLKANFMHVRKGEAELKL